VHLGRDLPWASIAQGRLTRKSAPTTPLPLPSAIACCDDDFEALRLRVTHRQATRTTNTVRSLIADGSLEASEHAGPSILAEHRPSNEPVQFGGAGRRRSFFGGFDAALSKC
jgi:hypothetical protein